MSSYPAHDRVGWGILPSASCDLPTSGVGGFTFAMTRAVSAHYVVKLQWHLLASEGSSLPLKTQVRTASMYRVIRVIGYCPLQPCGTGEVYISVVIQSLHLLKLFF